MKFSSNSAYEAAFVRTTNHDAPTPEELADVDRRRRRRRAFGAVAIVLLVASGVAFAVVASRRDTPEKQVRRGIAYAANHSHVAAIIEFKRTLQEQPAQPEIRLLLGQELSLMGDAKGAEIEFQKAADVYYQPERTLPLLASSLLHQGKFDRVIALVNDTRIDSPAANAELLAMRGSSYYALGREEEAQASWNAANEFVPGNPATVLAQARALAAKRAFEDAGRALDGIGPDAPQVEVLSLRGEIARATGRPLDAVTAYQAALKLEPGNLFMREGLAQTFVELKRFDEASDQVKRVLLPMPKNANAHFIKALIAVGRQDFAAADESAGLAVQIQPTDGRFQLLAGTIALQLGRRSDAQQHLRDAVTLLPNNVDARRMLALIYLEKRDANKADEVFRPVFRTFPTNAEYASIAARIATLQGRPAVAAHAFDQVDAADPKNVAANVYAATLLFAAGDKAGGYARLRAAAQADPGNAEVDVATVKAHLGDRDVQGAQAAWNTLAQKQPNTARTFNLRAGIDLARNDKPAARRAMQQAIEADPHYLAAVSGLAMLDLADHKPDQAREQLRRFIAANPTDVDAVLLLIQVEKSNGDDPNAIGELLQQAMKANPRSPQLTYALVDEHASHGRMKEAIAAAEQGLTFAPNDASLLQFVGERALAANDTEKAVDIFSKLADNNASSAEYPMLLGLAQLAAGNGEETLTAFRMALAREPDNLDRQLTMVNSLIAAGKTNEAGRMYYEVTRLAPRSPLLPELDADVKFGLKQYPEANAAYRKAVAQRPSSRLAIKTYNALTTALQRGEASAFLNEWLKAHPNDEQLRRFDADVAMRAKDYARAVHDFRLLAAAHPNDARILNNLAWNLAQTGDPQAMTYAERANALAPDDAAAGDTLGWMLVEKGDAARGLALIEKASVAAPDELEIRLHLAKAQLKEGQRDAARQTLKGLIAKAPASEQGKASQALLAGL